MSKLDDAIAYLRSRNLYCIDKGTKFEWRHGSDVAKTTADQERRLKKLADGKPANVSVLRKVAK